MKDRVITLLGAMAALYIVIAIFVQPQMSGDNGHSWPASNDRGKNGLMALHDWLKQSGVPVASLRRRYADIGKIDGIPGRGNLLIVATPQITPARNQDIDALMSWLHQGNDLLLLAAASDAILHEQQSLSPSRILGRLGFQLRPRQKNESDQAKPTSRSKNLREAVSDLGKAVEVKMVPVASLPVLAGINSMQGKMSKLAPIEYLLVSSSGNRASLALMRDSKTRTPAMWELRYGNSRVWLSRFGYLFSNAQLASADNAKMIANIVTASLGTGGKVIFDDMHQGQSELYDEKAFFRDSRLHNTLWFVFAFWVLYVAGHTNRIAPFRPAPRPARVIDFVEAMANLFARRLTPLASARLLFSHFFDWIRLRYSLPTNGLPVWQLLEHTERVDGNDLAELKQSYADIENNKKVNLVKLVNRMQKIRSALS